MHTNQFQVEGNAPIHVAALIRNFKIFQYIFEKSSNKNHRNGNGSTSLHLAAMEGQYDICKMIIESNTMNINVRNNAGDTALDKAATEGHSEICRILLENHIDKSPRAVDR